MEISREVKTIGALGHDIIVHEAQSPTCTATGWDEYETCSRCDYTTFKETSTNQHNYDENGLCLDCNHSAFVFEIGNDGKIPALLFLIHQ